MNRDTESVVAFDAQPWAAVVTFPLVSLAFYEAKMSCIRNNKANQKSVLRSRHPPRRPFRERQINNPWNGAPHRDAPQNHESRLATQQRHSIGGADRDRTGGLLVANQALSQLSYSPFLVVCGSSLVIR